MRIWVYQSSWYDELPLAKPAKTQKSCDTRRGKLGGDNHEWLMERRTPIGYLCSH